MQEQSAIEKVKLERLSVWKPWEQARLLWWIFVIPSKVRAYEEDWGKQALGRARNRLSGTLVCAWLFLLTLALGLETMPRPENSWSATAYLGMSGAVLGVWVLDGWRRVRAVRWVVAFVVGVIAYLPMILLAAAMSIDLASGVLVIIVFAVALFIMETSGVLRTGATAGITGGVAAGVEFSVGPIICYRMIMPVQDAVSSLMDSDGAGIGKGDFIAFLAIFLTLVLVILAVWFGERIRAKYPVEMGYLALATLLASYVLLSGYCFLGGWRVFG